jgi:CheY-specific phosphatase CheX
MSNSKSNDDVVLALMAQHLGQATVDMFADYDLLIRSAATESTDRTITSEDGKVSYAAIIGYVAKGLRGALILVAEDATVRAWLTHLGSEDTEIADALGEFANMALGRLKAAMIPEGVALQLSTPTIASGKRLALSGPPNLSKWLSFDGPAWNLRLRLDLELDPGFELVPAESELASAEAGDAFMF